MCLHEPNRPPAKEIKLTPRRWTWDGTNPDSSWLDNCPPDRPVVWRAALTDVPATHSHLISLLSAAERARLARLRLHEDQMRFLIGRGLLRVLASAHLNVRAETLQFDHGPFGKPFLASRANSARLHFNVSHSGKLVLLAFHPLHEVGVDVEKVRPNSEMEKIAREIFPPGEHRAWLKLNPAAQLTAFYQTWTRREARLKTLGIGFLGERNPPPTAHLNCFDLMLPEGYRGAAGCLILPASGDHHAAGNQFY
jgi:4'-phosphopantetheinyl transferase